MPEYKDESRYNTPPEEGSTEATDINAEQDYYILEKAKNSYKREKRIKDLRNYLAWALLVFISVLFATTIVVWALQYLIPEKLDFYRLDKGQLEKLQVFLLSGSVTAFLNIAGRKLLEDM